MTEYYKVVYCPMYKRDLFGDYQIRKLYSAINSVYPIEYKVGEWVKPSLERSKLFVFNDLIAAKRFNHEFIYFGQIYKCEVKNPEVAKFAGFGLLTQEHYREFWDWYNSHDGKEYPYAGIVHRNSVLCDAVKLLERIQ